MHRLSSAAHQSRTSISSKHFVNVAAHLVASALHSLTLTNPSVAVDAANKIVYRRQPDAAPHVSVVSGGGSGHEPSFAGMVGPGILAAAVAGSVFASPAAEQVRAGVLVVVMNYTGDVFNFGVAVERARAAGRTVEMVGVGRGIAGTVLVLKMAGALAAAVARLAAANVASVGASLDRVHLLGRRRGRGRHGHP